MYLLSFIQNDHNAAYYWNGVNYLLKMPSDLDYLNEYRTVKKWLGFKIQRNPFCVPFPLEEGAPIYTGEQQLDKQIYSHASQYI